MKYTIFGFSQCLMVEGGLNISDAGILRFIVDFYHTGKMRKTMVEGREYIWINYKYVAENLPIIFNGPKALSLRTQKRRVSESLDKLHVAGVIEKLITKDATGTFVFVRIIEAVYAQYIAGVTQKQVTGYTKTGNPVTQKQVTKDYSINNSSIKSLKDLPAPIGPETEKELPKKKKGINYTEEFEAFYSRYPRKKNKGAAFKAFKKISEPIPNINELEFAIEAASKTKDWKDPQFIPHPATWLNARGWEDEQKEPEKEVYRDSYGRIVDPNKVVL